MLIRMGGPAMWIRSIVFVTPYTGSFSLFDQYLVVFGLFLAKTEEQNYHTQKYYFMSICGKGWRSMFGQYFIIFNIS